MTPETPHSIIQKLTRPDDQLVWQKAWRQFVELYTPVMYIWLRQAGLSRPAADDVVQDVFILLVEEIKQFSREKGKFRTWLRTIALNKYRESKRKKGNDAAPLPEEGIADPAEEFWQHEYREHLVRQALMIIKRDFSESAWQGFWQNVVEGRPAAQIAAEQGKNVSAVIAANYRILVRLKEEFGDMWE